MSWAGDDEIESHVEWRWDGSFVPFCTPCGWRLAPRDHNRARQDVRRHLRSERHRPTELAERRAAARAVLHDLGRMHEKLRARRRD